LVDLQAGEVADYIGLAALAGVIGRTGACRLGSMKLAWAMQRLGGGGREALWGTLCSLC
jgi:hypothetical protein